MEWARVRNDPFQVRSKIALDGISKMPAGPNDPVVERMIWALGDPVAAEALALDPPIVDENDYPKIERWLEMFTQGGLLRCTPANAQAGAGDKAAAFVRLVDSGFESRNSNNLDMTRRHLAFWIARHLHVPQVLAWVLRNGGHLHPRLRGWVQAQLSDSSTDIAPKLRLLWTVLSNHQPEDKNKFLFSSDQYARAASDTERCCIEDDAIQSMAPRLIAVCQRRLKIRPKGGAKDCQLGWWSDLGVRLGVGDAVRGFFGGSGQRSHAELKRSAPAGRPQGGTVCRVGVGLATRALEARRLPGPRDGVPQFSYRRCFCGRGSG